MLPWKVFIRSVGAVTLLTMGGLAAGGDVVPFSHVSRSVGAQAVVEEEAVPAAEADETPAVDEAALPADDESTTIEIPGTAAPDIIDEVDPPESTPSVVDVTDPPDAPTTSTPPTAPPTTSPGTDAPDAAPTTPAEDDAPVVCAVAVETACGPADRELAAEDRFDARVDRCEAWWNRLADRLEGRDRPRWAARARMVAERCEAIITRWQERKERREERREERQDRRVEERKVKGDHNCDGHPDNGWHNKPGYPFPCDDAPRPEAAPQARKAERHREGRR